MSALVPPASPRRLGVATLAALGVAALVLVVAVLPAEYGVDPTGLGSRLGFARLADAPAAEVNATPATTGPAETYAFAARWRLVEEEIGSFTGDLRRSQTQDEVELPLNLTNLTRLTARLAWTDDVPASGPDTFEVSVRAPNDRQSDLVRGADGFANVTLAWRSVPYPANDGASLRLESASDTSSHGAWRVVIRLYGTGATDTAPDNGNPWTLRLVAERYELDAREVGVAADTIAFTLQPRQQVEYKFAMDANASMTYRWRSTAPVHSDLHGDHFESPEDFTSAKVATLAQDEGVYVAPFHGRHGWYWRNDGDATATIVLETSGAYTILGVV